MKTGEVGTYGGRFVIAASVAPQSFNPVIVSSAYSVDITSRLFARLVQFRLDTQEDVPSLASSWEMASDGLSCTFHLRRGAKFSDGHPITAEDVLFSFAAIYDPSVGAFGRDELQSEGRSFTVTAPDPLTVVVRSPEPNSSLLAAVGGVSILPKHVLEPMLQSGSFNSAYAVNTPPAQLVTSGPWMLKEFLPNERTVLTRNAYWFGVDREKRRLPYLDELVFLIASDQDAAHLKFEVGEVDALTQPAPANFRWFADNQRAGGFTLHDLGPDLGILTMFFNQNGPERSGGTIDAVKARWFGNATFRRAISMALDRDAMINAVFFSDGVKSWAISTPADKVWALPDVPHDDYNPQQARTMLESLGFADRDRDGVLEDGSGRPLTFSLKTTSNNAIRVALANFIRDDLAKVGVRVTVAPVEFNSLTTNVNRDFRYEAVILGFGRRRPDPGLATRFWRSSGTHPWHPRQQQPDSPEQARVDQLANQIVTTMDVEKRKALWKELHTIANQQAWVIWLPIQNNKAPIRDKFRNLRPSGVSSTAAGVVWNAEEIFVKAQARETN